MDLAQFLVLGALAGFTIFLGLPIGRLRSASRRLTALLNAITIGVLFFLLFDVLSHALEPIDTALTGSAVTKSASWWPFVGLALVFFIALTVGILSLALYDRWVGQRAKTTAEVNPAARGGLLRLHEGPSRLAFLIAVGIGLHNFSEGLAIGQSAASGQISLAVVLVVGFGPHNATEGFGITAPLAGGARRPSWLQLAVLGLIGGVPTLIGTLTGSFFISETVSVLFLALAAGSILYVIIQLLKVAQKLSSGTTLYIGVLGGLTAGLVTDFIVTAAGV